VEARGPDRLEERALPVESDEAALAHVADGEREEAGRVDVAVVGDEDDAFAVARAFRLRARR